MRARARCWPASHICSSTGGRPASSARDAGQAVRGQEAGREFGVAQGLVPDDLSPSDQPANSLLDCGVSQHPSWPAWASPPIVRPAAGGGRACWAARTPQGQGVTAKSRMHTAARRIGTVRWARGCRISSTANPTIAAMTSRAWRAPLPMVTATGEDHSRGSESNTATDTSRISPVLSSDPGQLRSARQTEAGEQSERGHQQQHVFLRCPLETEQRHQRAKYAVQGCMPAQRQEQSQQRERPQSPAGGPVAGAQPDQSQHEHPGAQIDAVDQRAIVVGPIPGPGSARVAAVRVAHRLRSHELGQIVSGEVTTVRRCGGTIRRCARSRRGRPIRSRHGRSQLAASTAGGHRQSPARDGR